MSINPNDVINKIMALGYPTQDGARTGAEELKKRFPMLQIRIYDAQTQTREDVELP